MFFFTFIIRNCKAYFRQTPPSKGIAELCFARRNHLLRIFSCNFYNHQSLLFIKHTVICEEGGCGLFFGLFSESSVGGEKQKRDNNCI